jgi:carboxylesterase type B
LAKNLFRGVIAESGGILASNDPQNMYIWHYSIEEAEERSSNFLKSKGIDSNITAKELRALPVRTFVENHRMLDNEDVF